jgi:hypothetical protein
LEELTLPGFDDERRRALEIVARFDAPAYIRRARRVEAAYEGLLAQLRARRDQLLQGVRLQLRLLLDTAGRLDALRPVLTDGQFELLRGWVRQFALAERADPPRAGPRRLRRGLADLAESVARFNRKWLDHLADADLSEVNAERDGYNRYYLLEKECAVGVVRGRQGFQKLLPVTRDELLTLFPPLPTICPRAAR